MDFAEYREPVHSWIEQIQKYRGEDAEKTLLYSQKLEDYAVEHDDIKLLGIASYYFGETYYVLNDGEHFFKYITRAISYLDEAKQWNLVALACNLMAITSMNRGNAPIAMDYYLRGLNYCKKYDMKYEERILTLNLGTLYLSNKQYQEAQKRFEYVLGMLGTDEEEPNYYSVLNCIYTSMGRCYMLRDMPEKAQEYINRLDNECWEKLDKLDRLYTLCFKAEYYNRTGRSSLRDECIQIVHDNTNVDMPVMDIFEDYDNFCEMLLKIGCDDVFWDIMKVLEELTDSARIINLKHRVLSLKIEYYRMHGEEQNYLRAAGMYYEMSKVLEQENSNMVANMLRVRNSLEEVKAKRRELLEENEELQKKSETDALTKLPNRFRLNAYSEEAFERAMSERSPLAVEILDIDYFKEYNDNYGHQAGDRCIASIAKELQKMQDDKIFVARYGGDEFIIIYENMTEQAVREKAEDLKKRIMDLQITHEYSKSLPIVTVSQGICYDIPRGANRNWDFLSCADNRLYRAKKANRNNISMGYMNVVSET